MGRLTTPPFSRDGNTKTGNAVDRHAALGRVETKRVFDRIGGALAKGFFRRKSLRFILSCFFVLPAVMAFAQGQTSRDRDQALTDALVYMTDVMDTLNSSIGLAGSPQGFVLAQREACEIEPTEAGSFFGEGWRVTCPFRTMTGTLSGDPWRSPFRFIYVPQTETVTSSGVGGTLEVLPEGLVGPEWFEQYSRGYRRFARESDALWVALGRTYLPETLDDRDRNLSFGARVMVPILLGVYRTDPDVQAYKAMSEIDREADRAFRASVRQKLLDTVRIRSENITFSVSILPEDGALQWRFTKVAAPAPAEPLSSDAVLNWQQTVVKRRFGFSKAMNDTFSDLAKLTRLPREVTTISTDGCEIVETLAYRPDGASGDRFDGYHCPFTFQKRTLRDHAQYTPEIQNHFISMPGNGEVFEIHLPGPNVNACPDRRCVLLPPMTETPGSAASQFLEQTWLTLNAVARLATGRNDLEAVTRRAVLDHFSAAMAFFRDDEGLQAFLADEEASSPGSGDPRHIIYRERLAKAFAFSQQDVCQFGVSFAGDFYLFCRANSLPDRF